MRPMFRIAAIALLISSAVYADLATSHVNRTFMLPRAQDMNLAQEFVARDRILYTKKQKFGGSIFATPFFNESTNSNEIGRYFMFDGKNTLKVATQATNAKADIDPRHLDLGTSFEGDVTFKPEHQATGAHLFYFHQFKTGKHPVWAELHVPVVHVKNDVRLNEAITTADTSVGGVTTITAAFKGDPLSSGWAENWNYGKVDGARERTGVANVNVRGGFRVWEKDDYYAGVHGMVGIPVSNSSHGRYVFEPMVGNGDHWALGVGLDGSMNMWKHAHKDRRVNIRFMSDYRFYFDNTQKRTLGLKDKRWGQYLRMRKQDSSDTTQVLASFYPGVNVLTRNVEVRAGSQANMVGVVNYVCKRFTFNVGYDFWIRGNEDLTLKDAWEDAGVFGISSDNTSSAAMPAGDAVSSETTIKELASGNGTFLTESDVVLKGQPPAMTHKIFGTLNYVYNKGDYPILFSLGGSYEAAPKKTALEMWSVWGTVGVSF